MRRLISILILVLIPTVAHEQAMTFSDVAHMGRTVRTAAPGGDGPNVWYWAGTGKGDSNFTTESTSDWAPQTYAYGANITVSTGGTCNKLAVKCGTDHGSTIPFKIALFNSSNALVVSGTGTVPNNATITWVEVTVTDTTVAAGTYYVLVSAEGANADWGYDTGQNGLYDDVVYASFPPGTASPSTETGQIYGVKMYVD